MKYTYTSGSNTFDLLRIVKHWISKNDVYLLCVVLGEAVMVDQEYNRRRLKRLLHTRHMVCWHDHR